MGRTSFFNEPDVIDQDGALEIDEGVVARSVSLDPLFVLSFDAAEGEGVEFVRRALEQLGGEICSGTVPLFDANDEGEDTFVDVIGGGQRDKVAESEGFRFADGLLRANLHSETFLEGFFPFIRTAIVLVFILHFR